MITITAMTIIFQSACFEQMIGNIPDVRETVTATQFYWNCNAGSTECKSKAKIITEKVTTRASSWKGFIVLGHLIDLRDRAARATVRFSTLSSVCTRLNIFHFPNQNWWSIMPPDFCLGSGKIFSWCCVHIITWLLWYGNHSTGSNLSCGLVVKTSPCKWGELKPHAMPPSWRTAESYQSRWLDLKEQLLPFRRRLGTVHCSPFRPCHGHTKSAQLLRVYILTNSVSDNLMISHRRL
jgi:hypothetical protein